MGGRRERVGRRTLYGALVPCHHGRLRERDARGPGASARVRAVRCAHALLRRALLHQVHIDQPQGLELPPVLLDLTQAVLQGMATVRGVYGDGRCVGAWGHRRRPALLSYSLVLQTIPPCPRPN